MRRRRQLDQSLWMRIRSSQRLDFRPSRKKVAGESLAIVCRFDAEAGRRGPGCLRRGIAPGRLPADQPQPQHFYKRGGPKH